MAKTVADPSEAIVAMQPDWELARALLGGTNAMRAAGVKYLPKWPEEEHKAYECRLASAVLFPAYQRTVQTLAAKPFSKPITIGEDVPSQIQDWCEDIDLQGRNLHTFGGDLMQTALGYGLGGILVDYPKAEGVRTVADERALGLRPYMVDIKPWQILGFIPERVAGMWRLRQFRFMEWVEEPDGQWGTQTIPQVRVLEPGRWEIHRQNEKKEWVLYEEGVTSIDFIPFVPVYGERVGFMLGRPPMLELAHLNVAHWQSASDQQTILHVARVPILTVIGAQDEVDSNGKVTPWKLTVGSSAAVKLPQGGDMKYVEHSGKAIDAGGKDLEALEERMRQAGAELLVLAPGKVTATQVATENAVGMCALQRIAEDLEDALDAALEIMAKWVKIETGGHVSLFKDFGAATLAEASADLLLKSNMAGKISDETYRAELQRRGILSADVDEQEEKDRIELEGPELTAEPAGVGQ
jgi:hypothetical protein